MFFKNSKFIYWANWLLVCSFVHLKFFHETQKTFSLSVTSFPLDLVKYGYCTLLLSQIFVDLEMHNRCMWYSDFYRLYILSPEWFPLSVHLLDRGSGTVQLSLVWLSVSVHFQVSSFNFYANANEKRHNLLRWSCICPIQNSSSIGVFVVSENVIPEPRHIASQIYSAMNSFMNKEFWIPVLTSHSLSL